MLAGLVVASLQFVLDQNKGNFLEDSLFYELSHLHAIYLFPIIFFVSVLGSFLGTYFSEPTNMDVLKSFYRDVRPWGFWKPVLNELKKENKAISKNSEFWFDMMNCTIGIIWQSSMIVLPIYLMIRDYPKMWISITVFLLTSIVLKFTWLDRVKKLPN